MSAEMSLQRDDSSTHSWTQSEVLASLLANFDGILLTFSVTKASR